MWQKNQTTGESHYVRFDPNSNLLLTTTSLWILYKG